jgi:hypothetical protein
MLKNLWYRIRSWFAESTSTNHVLYQELITSEYKSILYALHRAGTLQQLMELRKRIRELQQLLIEGRLEYWGRPHIIDLTKLWNAKFRYWKDKARSH